MKPPVGLVVNALRGRNCMIGSMLISCEVSKATVLTKSNAENGGYD